VFPAAHEFERFAPTCDPVLDQHMLTTMPGKLAGARQHEQEWHGLL